MSASKKKRYPVNYEKAARRHLKDANLLYEEKRFANAWLLYGFCVECGLSALLVKFEAPLDNFGNIEVGTYRQHMPHMRKAVNDFIQKESSGRQVQSYLVNLPTLKMLDGWLIYHRYYSDEKIPFLGNIDDWKQAAHEVETMLDRLQGAR